MDGAFQVSFYQGKSEVRSAYSELLESLPWDYFVTQTFRRLRRDTIHAPAQHWEALQEAGATRAFVAVEPHYLDGLHLHTLARFPGDMAEATLFHRLDLRRDLKNNFGFVTVDRIKSHEQVTTYCSKYVTKGMATYDFFGNPGAWSPSPHQGEGTSQLPML